MEQFDQMLKELAEKEEIIVPDGFDERMKSTLDSLPPKPKKKGLGAVKTALIAAAAKKYGDQCVVLSMDVKRLDGQFRLFAKGGREDTGIDAMDWAVRGAESGAGEIVLNSIDTDGVKDGFDLEMLDALAARVRVPIVASGGAGNMAHFAELFTHPGIDAGLAASIFHTKQVDIKDLKRYLRGKGVEMRL